MRHSERFFMLSLNYYIKKFKEYGIKQSIDKFLYNRLLLPKKYFSEHGEDILLSNYCNAQKGFYVDVGAYHPKRFSNTYKFYKKGWSGINIEPNPHSISKFKRQRKRDKNLNLGVSDIKGELDFFVYGKDSASNTFSIERNSLFKEQNSINTEIIKVKVDTLNNILSEYKPKDIDIDFLTIDVEGLELVILKSIDFERFAPKMILVEDLFFYNQENDIIDYHSSELYQFLKSKNYVFVAKTWYTLLFKRVAHH